jgi:hypothetical protein
MMKRMAVAGALAVWWAATSVYGVDVFLLEGQITDASLYVRSDTNPHESYPFYITPGFPVSYTAVFSYDAIGEVATFNFTPLVDDIEGTQLIDENLFPGVLRNDDAALVVDFEPPIQSLMNFFELTLDKATGAGEWRWSETCPVCDRILDPTARATITSFREVLGGDFNADGDVDGEDLARWRLGFGSQGFPVRDGGDADADLDVDGRDFLVWQRQVGATSGAVQSSPEPAGAVMAALAAMGVGLTARRRRSQGS